MIKAIKSAYSQYFSTSGRATRSEYWLFCFFQFIVYFIYVALTAATSVDIDGNEGYVFIPICLFAMFNITPNFTILIRRLHDSSKSGWWILLLLLSGPGAFILFIFTLLGSEGDNKYGKNPRNLDL